MNQTRKILGTVLVVAAVLIIAACENPTALNDGETNDTEDDTSDAVTIDPPENILGTIALSDGTAAVVDISFSESSAQVVASATHSVSGSVRYNSEDYSADGSYDNQTGEAEVTATGSAEDTFAIAGTWDLEQGFSGTVTYSDSDGTEIATGSISAAGVDTGQESTLSVFVGTYGGSVYGSWNGVISDSRFYGTYAASDGTGEQGSFSASYSSGAIDSGAAGPEETPFGGKLSESGDSVGGWYAEEGTEEGVPYQISGTWSGVKVDADNDAPVIASDSDDELVANRILQAMGTLLRKALQKIENDSEDPDIAWDSSEDYDPTVTVETGVTVTLDAEFDGAVSESSFQGYREMSAELDSDGFADSVSGITLGEGEFRATFDTTATPSILYFDTLSVDIDEATQGDDGGVTIIFPDDSTGNLFIDGTISKDSENVGGVWELDSADISTTVQDVLF
jgi:hypothetical protein